MKNIATLIALIFCLTVTKAQFKLGSQIDINFDISELAEDSDTTLYEWGAKTIKANGEKLTIDYEFMTIDDTVSVEIGQSSRGDGYYLFRAADTLTYNDSVTINGVYNRQVVGDIANKMFTVDAPYGNLPIKIHNFSCTEGYLRIRISNHE